jgi:N-hydroxyarylamine O-acetyltransferase
MKLAAYLERIRLQGSVRPDFETLRRVHLAHQLSVPFENLDVQLRQPLTTSVESSFEKIVRRGRGGWCFEMNGLLSWALREMGFDVQRVAAAVMRERRGDEQMGNHLCLLVRLDQTYLVDVGFGGSLAEPMPLRDFQREDRPYRLSLQRIADDFWRFSEVAHGDPFSFDFRAASADEDLLARKCQFLQADAASTFVQNLVVQRRTLDAHVSLRGRVLTTLHASHQEKRTLASADELVATLRERFDLNVPEVATLWPAICARHEAVFASEPERQSLATRAAPSARV